MSHLYRRPPKKGMFWYAGYKNGKLIRKSLRTKDHATAKYLQAKLDQEVMEGKYQVIKTNYPCAILLSDYVRAQEHHRGRRVNENCRSRIERFFSWANIRIVHQITAGKLQDYLNHRINTDKVSLYEANNMIANVKSFLNWCITTGQLVNDPLKSVKKYRLPEQDVRFLSQEEITTILAASGKSALYCDGDPALYPAIATAIYTGMRKSELFTLRWEDIDFKRDEVKVRNKPGFTTKSKRNRIIPLHSKLHAMLLSLRQKEGRCFDTGNHRRIFGRIIEEAKLSGIGWHTFRHTFASQAIMAGVPLVTVSKWLGHADIKTTMIYSHLSRDHEKEEIKKLTF